MDILKHGYYWITLHSSISDTKIIGYYFNGKWSACYKASVWLDLPIESVEVIGKVIEGEYKQ